LDKQFSGTIFQFLIMSVRVISIAFGAYKSDPLLALIAFSFSSAACYLLFLIWLTRESGGSAIKMIKILCQAAIVSSLVLLVCFFNYFAILEDSRVLIDLLMSVVFVVLAYLLNYKIWNNNVKN
ncbi:hypothetical protein ABMA58_12670, partial [Oceanospirillum sp. HFRX-1_2]